MSLRSAVYIAPPIPFQNPGKTGRQGLWSPISCTLIYSAKEAVLVDTPITIKQTRDLIAWIERIAPGRKLSYIYITHGHGDHFFGLPLLTQRFPETQPVATEATVRHMRQQIEEKNFHAQWGTRFPGEIAQPFVLAQPLPSSNEFTLQGKWTMRAIEVGHTDTYGSSVLWVEDLRLAVCGDVVYGQVHQMLFEANTASKREEWIRAVEIVEALGPCNTKEYIRAFGEVQGKAKSAREIVKAMTELYPDRYNTGALIMGAMGAMQVKESRI
ncbi:MBL fold metallo-hydrolase [Aspergillus tanneri]|uniref:Metallo-beta-lactamase domain-containing protein n=1 Tax=Aspergillus tanneri TaxID=1220188 RepID=A0A5M9MAM7_9EURO|nr:uncharacterized protein ATNIH1004_008144 [Aspergillus tanneri]KAA8643948.1 hypothetical protein ATNIH1004_008144 [Aspergillus tanneri]